MQAELNTLRLFLQRMIAVPGKLWADVEARFRRKEMRRRNLFVKEGKGCRGPAFVTQGSVRYYRTTDGGEATKTC